MSSRMDRGEYRSLYVAMADDPDIHAMTGDAFKLLIMLKMSLGPAGIGVVYRSKLCDQVGCDAESLEQLFAELEAPKPGNDHGWIERERNVVWIINALAFEPNFTPQNAKKHVPYIRGLVAQISPSLAIARHFRERYPEWFVDEPKRTEKAEKIGNRKGIDTVSGDEKREGNDTQSDRVSIHKTRQNNTKQESGDLGRERAAARESSAPLASALADLPTDATRFLKHFYPKGRASKDRREDVARQILGTLQGGTPLRRGEIVHAITAERLAAKAREVINEGVSHPDKAIVVLLLKLNDTSDVTERAAKAVAAEVKSQENSTARELASAEAWLADHPLVESSIDAELVAQGYPVIVDESKPDAGFNAVCRRFMKTSLVLTAWRKAGAPELANV